VSLRKVPQKIYRLSLVTGKGETKISNEDKLKKGKDIASAIGDMYEAVDKSKQACKETPLIKAEFGYKFPIKPSDEALKETDPSKRPAPYIGGTITVFF